MERRKGIRSMSEKRLALFKAGKLKKPKPKAWPSSKAPRKAMRPRAKGNTGQMEAFVEVWNDPERPHVCEVCGAELFPKPDDMGDRAAVEAWVRQFSHLLPKGSYRKMKTNPRNIRLQCHECHDKWHEFKDTCLRYEPAWRPTFDLYDQLKKEANGVKP
jgi:hypothetical protein